MLRYLLLLTLLTDTVLAASTWRCGSSVVSLKHSTHEVENRCGAPENREFLGYKAVLDDYGYRQEVQVEEWTYGPNNGMRHYLRFEGNSLVNIQSKRVQ